VNRVPDLEGLARTWNGAGNFHKKIFFR